MATSAPARITAIGSPFFKPDGSVVGAVGVVAPTSRFGEAQDKLVDTVLGAADRATEVFGVAP